MASVSCAPLYGVHHLVILLLFLLLIHETRSSCPGSFHFHPCGDNVFEGQLNTTLFTTTSLHPDQGCGGPCELTCDSLNRTMIQCTQNEEPPYQVLFINPNNATVVVKPPNWGPPLPGMEFSPCKAYKVLKASFPSFRYVSLTNKLHDDDETETYLGCPDLPRDAYWDPDHYKACRDAIVYGPYAYGQLPPGKPPPDGCMQFFNYLLTHYPEDSNNKNQPSCPLPSNNKGKRLKIILPSVFGVVAILLIAVIIYWWQRNKKSGSTTPPSRIMSLNHTRSDLEEGSINNGMTVFSYAELQQVTNNFDPARELGEGGFGVVYYGKLQDGREVAVKRMYEKNYKQVEQFKNEIQILTNMRHQNLVTLYGSSSRHSRELLLVYEYIPNGTVADHLHGDQSKSVLLLWPTRMKIAIETASALSYLHYNDIIHRDIKTNNILLDRHFCAKVADFGLSRLFPPDMTHVSTAPQGTPGYLDPVEML